MDPAVALLIYLIAGILALAALFAQFRLFSIDNSLKQIIARLPEPQKTEAAPVTAGGKYSEPCPDCHSLYACPHRTTGLSKA